MLADAVVVVNGIQLKEAEQQRAAGGWKLAKQVPKAAHTVIP
jgi:hypothetical protein